MKYESYTTTNEQRATSDELRATDSATIKPVHKKIVIISAVTLATAGLLGGVGYWSMHLNQPDVTRTATAGGSIALSPSQASADSGSTSVPLSNDSSGSSGSSSTAAAASNSLQVNNPASSSNGRSENPGTDFKTYDQYKTAQSAMFGDIVKGTGVEAAAGKKLTVNYRGWLTSGQLFDDSYAKGNAFSFTPGEHKVILGWEEGVLGMKVGGKRRLIVPPGVGYGDQAHGPIPAGSVLVFDIELLAVQ